MTLRIILCSILSTVLNRTIEMVKCAQLHNNHINITKKIIFNLINYDDKCITALIPESC